MRLTYTGSLTDVTVRHPLTGEYLTAKRGDPLEFSPAFDLDEYPLGSDWVSSDPPAPAPKPTPAKPAPTTPEGEA